MVGPPIQIYVKRDLLRDVELVVIEPEPHGEPKKKMVFPDGHF